MTVECLQPIDRALSRRAILRGGALLCAGAALGGAPPFDLPARAAAGTEMEARWPKVTALLDRYVAGRKLPGGVAAMGWGDSPLGAIMRGHEGFTDADMVTPDSLFRLYSMTKPITGMAAMILIAEGKLRLDQPLADFIPEFAHMQVAVDPGKNLDSRPARTQITIRHLLTHTSGLGYAGVPGSKVNDELLRLGVTPASVSHLQIPGITAPVPTPGPDEFLRRAAKVPLVAEPGTRWSYSMGLDILGLVIGRVAGARSFGQFVHERLLEPLGMASSFFRVPSSDEPRLTTNYGVIDGVAVPIDKPADSVFLETPPFAFGGAGLISTPADYDRFLQMLINGGMAGARRVMSEQALALGMSNLLPEGVDTRGTLAEGGGFGAGGRVGLGEDAGSFGWSGAAGTVGFVNTRIGLRAGLYVQFMPPGTYPIQQEFLAAAREDALGRMNR